MPYQVIDPIDLPPLAASGSYPVTLSNYGLTLVDDDHLLLGIVCGANSGTLSVSGSGWSEIVELDVTLGQRMALYKVKVASGAAADPTVSLSAGTAIWQAFLMQWRDAETTAFNLTAQTKESNAVSVTLDASTPSENDCTIVYFAASRISGATSCRFLSDKVVGQLMRSFDDNATFIGYALGTVQQATAADTAQTAYAALSSRMGVISLAIKNKVSGGKERDCRAAMTKVGWFGDYGTAHESLTSLTMNAPSTFCVWGGTPEAVAGINLATGTSTVDNTVQGLPPFTGRYTQFSITGAAAEWSGNWWALPSTLDMTGKILSIEWFMTLTGVQIGGSGVVIAFGDSATADAGNAALFQLAPKHLIPVNTLVTNHIAVDAATPFAAVGSIDWSSIDKIGIFVHRAGTAGTRTISFRNLFLHGQSNLVGGNAGRPLNIKFLDYALNGWGYTGICGKQGDAVLVKTSTQFGDGAVATYLDTTATLLNTPQMYSTFAQPFWNVPANEITIGMKAASGDTMRFVASAMAAGAGAEQNFTIDPATSSGATVSFAGEVISNFLFAGDTDAPISGATFSGCDEVAFGGADVTNVTITDTTSTDAACSFDANGVVVTSSTIDGTGALYAIELGTAVTAITLADCIITAGITDKIHVLKTLTNVAAGAFVVGTHYRINTVGTTDFTAIGASANTIGVNFTATGAGTGTGTADQAVKITISGDTSLIETEVTTAGAPVWIAAPQPTLSATVLASSRVVLYNNTTSAELDNTAPAGTSWSKVITSGASANDSLTLHVFKEGYQEFSTTFLYTGEDTTILVTQEVDSNIASLRTELGITDYTTITEFALDVTGNVEIDADDADGSTTKARLAIWYNGVLTTENGARYLRGAITILSTAAFRINTSVLDLKIENISVTYGLNFTDTERRLYRDDGAPIYAAVSAPGSIQNDYSGVPDTVETGVSGLTGSESAQLMALPNATSIAAAVWAYVITGSTTAVQMMRGFAAVLLGKVSGAGTGTETFRDIADTTDVVVATVDSDGNRTAITRDLT